MIDDQRLIEDYLPIEKISAEASREKAVRKGHISTLHLWWARRPLVACRAAVYGALVSASQFVPNGASDEKKRSLGRANAAKFLNALCLYPAPESAVVEAKKHIVASHIARLAQIEGLKVSVEDILSERAPRPRVLDMFAGGGAIPLEALRLGCDAYALELNPVAHIIQLCTLVYPQLYGRPNKNDVGCGPSQEWAGLSKEVKHWGRWVLGRVKKNINDLYPLIPDPAFRGKRVSSTDLWGNVDETKLAGYLVPIAYLWTRIVVCKNPSCGAEVPLLKTTWLCKREGRYVALKIRPQSRKRRVAFDVVEAKTAKNLGFDPDLGSNAGNATCPFCGTVADSEYVKREGCAGRLSRTFMAVVCVRPGKRGKVYLSAEDVHQSVPADNILKQKLDEVTNRSGLTIPSERIVTDAKNCCWTHLYGLTKFADLFLPRQLICLLSFAEAVRDIATEAKGYSEDRILAIMTSLACWVNRLADFGSTLCTLKPGGERGVVHSFTRQAIPMVWDFAEANPFGTDSANAAGLLEYLISAIESVENIDRAANVARGSATSLPWEDGFFDAVVTDPPYYDNVAYADISDFFYVWFKRTIFDWFRPHFAADGTPKKTELVADATRHGGSKEEARAAYEKSMAAALAEANRVLKPEGALVVVYAHKTTLGWATLVDALRTAGFIVTEAWPLDTEMKSRLRGMDSAALASSIFLVARKRNEKRSGDYEEVRPELEAIVRERVTALWNLGISGADLVISCVGAGLRAFTKYGRVEYENGEEVPAGRFLTEVETVVLETILEKLSQEVGDKGNRHGLAGVDPWTRFYILWRYTYKSAELDAGEAIIFANGTHVELDGGSSLSHGPRPLVEKRKATYRLLDYSQRGENPKLGLPSEDGGAASHIDALHRLLWLMEHRPSAVSEFLQQARPNTEQLRLVAQALSGPALKGGELAEVATGSELAALTKLTANWRSVVEEEGPLFKSTGQRA